MARTTPRYMYGLTDTQALRMKHFTKITERSPRDLMDSGINAYLDFQDLKNNNRGKKLRLVAIDENEKLVKLIAAK